MNTVAAQEVNLTDIIGLIWNRIITQSNKLVDAHESFGFVQFKEKLNPKLEDVIRAFKVIDSALSVLLESKMLDYEETRIALNARQCILKMSALSEACDSKQEADCQRIINELRAQMP